MALAMALSSPWKASSVKLDAKRGELLGTRVQQQQQQFATPSRTPILVQPLASKVCQLTGKKYNNAMHVSFSHHRTKRRQHPNLQYKRLWFERAKKFVRLRISTNAIKTVDKKGLEVMAKEAGLNLFDYIV